MMTTSAFEVLGPIMVGPSSSHTAGALRIAQVARILGPKPLERVEFVLYNSFAHTYKGHGSDKALVAGILGLAPDDTRVRDSFELAKQANLRFEFIPSENGAGKHPNTVCIVMHGVDGTRMEVTGESLGGGRMRISSIDNIAIELSGDLPTIFVAHTDTPGVLASLTSELSKAHINIATLRTFRSKKGGQAYSVIEIDNDIPEELVGTLRHIHHVGLVNMVNIPGTVVITPDATLTHNFETGKELLELCQRFNLSIGEVMRLREYELSNSGDHDARMQHVLDVMRQEVHDPIEHPRKSLGGLLGGQAQMVAQAQDTYAHALMGTTLTRCVAFSMAVLERSATMGVIVAAPTAGSAGIVPGALLGVAQTLHKSDDEIARALWNACALGAILAHNASVAGAEGGCQAEVGSASAMAASAVCELLGAPAQVCLSAASTAIANLLGLVCDPVRGLVEYPCQDRNAIGVANAISAAQLALSGVYDPLPFDEVTQAMKEVGSALPASLRETALGGLAATPSAATAQAVCGSCNLCD